MSHLLSKIMLAIFMLPLAAMVYCMVMVYGFSLGHYSYRSQFLNALDALVQAALRSAKS